MRMVAWGDHDKQLGHLHPAGLARAVAHADRHVASRRWIAVPSAAATIGALQLALVFSILLRPTSAIIVTRPFIAKNLHHTTAVRMAKEEQPLYKEVINAARIDEKCAARMELSSLGFCC